MDKLCDKVLCKIKEEKIEPKSRWRFLLKDYFIWLAFGASVIVGALAFCVALSSIVDNDWDIYRYLSVSPMKHFLLSLPYLWIVLLVLFLGLAFYNYRHTKGAYRHGTFVVLGLSVVGGLVLGSVFHSFGMGRKIDRMLAKNIPLYQNINCCCNRKNIWTQPGKGLLGGKIISVVNPDRFEVEDFVGEPWEVEGINVLWRGSAIPRKGILIKIVGEKRENHFFRAREVRSWNGWESEE